MCAWALGRPSLGTVLVFRTPQLHNEYRRLEKCVVITRQACKAYTLARLHSRYSVVERGTPTAYNNTMSRSNGLKVNKLTKDFQMIIFLLIVIILLMQV